MASLITDSFTHDHHHCDRLLAAAESSLGGGDWVAITAATEALSAAMNRHFALEEEVLFPQLASVFLIAANPIEVMCSEHAQMRVLCEDLAEAVGRHEREDCLGILETLHFLAQQHNYKEEGVLYPMADGALPERAAEIAALIPHA